MTTLDEIKRIDDANAKTMGIFSDIFMGFFIPFIPFIFLVRWIRNSFRKVKKTGEMESFTIENFLTLFVMLLGAPIIILFAIIEFFSG